MYDIFTDRARKVMGLARQQAQRFNHDYIGTEHLLLGLINEGSGVAASVLKTLGVSLDKVQQEVEKLVSTGTTMITMGMIPLTPRAKIVLERALQESKNLGHTYIGSEHLLLGLIGENEGIAAQVLRGMRINSIRVRAEIMLMVGPSDFRSTKAETSRQHKVFSEANTIANEVSNEVVRATGLHGKFNSAHEGWAIIMEELDELWDEVRAKHHDKAKMREECIQVAAMAVRFIMDVCNEPA